MDKAPLTFEFLDAQIEAMPEGPVAALNMPRWMRFWTLIGVAGTVLALSPSLLIQWLTPAQWMVAMAQAGLAIMIVGFAPELSVPGSLIGVAVNGLKHKEGLRDNGARFTSLASRSS